MPRKSSTELLLAEIFTDIKTDRDVLFSGVRELVLSAAVVGLLDPWVGPQAFDSCDVRLIKPIDLFNVHLLHEHGIRLE